MAPSRGDDVVRGSLLQPAPSSSHSSASRASSQGSAASSQHSARTGHPGAADPSYGFTFRAVAVGAAVGTVICFSNMYFGLQTGWISPMTMPASLLGYGLFRMLERQDLLAFPFSPVENVLVQTVAGSMAIMPLGCGFVGVIPALSYLLTPEESGPINMTLIQALIWSVGLCYFGVLFAVPLRKQVLVREKLKFPSGFSTAVLIGVMHGRPPPLRTTGGSQKQDDSASHGFGALVGDLAPSTIAAGDEEAHPEGDEGDRQDYEGSWQNIASSTTFGQDVGITPRISSSILLLFGSFFFSGLFNLLAYFVPSLHAIPVFGQYAASTWLWDFNPSPAYVGQGIIMGPETTLHMLLGAAIGWGILSPLAKHRGWAPGEVKDWETGSKGWIVWVSLAIMLADSITSLGFMAFESFSRPLAKWCCSIGKLMNLVGLIDTSDAYFALSGSDEVNHGENDPPGLGENEGSLLSVTTTSQAPDSHSARNQRRRHNHRVQLRRAQYSQTANSNARRLQRKHRYHSHQPEEDAPLHQQIPSRVAWVGLAFSLFLCMAAMSVVFGPLMPLPLTIVSLMMALVLSIMGLRALGQTDLNPVSGISKLAQLLIAAIASGRGDGTAVVINLVAGAIAEAGALQAGDLMQDLKTGHLLGASPRVQFLGQLTGCSLGALASPVIYRLYTSVYRLPSSLFPVPTAYVWLFTARLVSGAGLPPYATPVALAFALAFAVLAVLRSPSLLARSNFVARYRHWIPGGIAVAIGMYNVPSFTLARAIGGIVNWWWVQRRGGQMTPLVLLASVSLLDLIPQNYLFAALT